MEFVKTRQPLKDVGNREIWTIIRISKMNRKELVLVKYRARGHGERELTL